jgi:hypothetical protein
MWGMRKRNGTTPVSGGSDPGRHAAACAAVLAEYKTLRVEIGFFQGRMQMICQLAFTVLIGLIGAAAVVANAGNGSQITKSQSLITFILVAVALLYFTLACLYAQSTSSINNAASYIHQHLRPQLVDLVGVEAWNWERYLATCRAGHVGAGRPRLLHRLLEWCIPWLVFMLPMGLCVLVFVLLHDTLLTFPAGWPAFLFAVLLVGLAVRIAAVTKGGHGVANESLEELQQWAHRATKGPRPTGGEQSL